MGGHKNNTSTHLEHEETILNGGSTQCHKTFKQHNNAHGLYVSDNDSENTSECHFKCQKIKPNPVYYDETNRHPPDVDVSFVDVPTSTQPMKLDGEKVIFFSLILTKINICLRWWATTNLSMNGMSHLLRIGLKVLLLLGDQRTLP